jgi:ribosomal protein L11 methyltransferase
VGPTLLLEVRVPPNEVDEASGLVWTSELATVIVERPAPAGWIDLRVGLVDRAPAESIAALVAVLAHRWVVEEVDDADEHLDLADALRGAADVVRAGDHLVVVPPWREATPSSRDIVVSIDPGSAFGSGSHVTTRLALAALERDARVGARVLDIGSGSGVLSVAAARLGAGGVVAVDVDPEAVDATGANAVRNGVSDRVTVVAGAGLDGIDRRDRFDIVVANLGAGVLVELASAIVDRLWPGGVALVTGILDEQVRDVTSRFVEVGAVLVEEHSRDGWSLLTFRVGQAS